MYDVCLLVSLLKRSHVGECVGRWVCVWTNECLASV